MKYFLLSTLFLFAFGTSSFSQFDINNIYGGANLGWASPMGKFKESANGGLTYNVEVGYKITEKLGVGIEYGTSLTVGFKDGLDIYGMNEYLAKANYRFFNKKFSPYAAVGLGVASVSEPDITVGNDTTIGSRSLGLGTVVEAGLDIYGVILAYRFNYNGNISKDAVYDVANAGTPVILNQFVVGYIYKFGGY